MGVDLLSLTEVLERTGLARATFFRVRQRGEFPEPVRLTTNKRVALWLSADVEAWCQRGGLSARVHRDP